jgi:hypothetical protein
LRDSVAPLGVAPGATVAGRQGYYGNCPHTVLQGPYPRLRLVMDERTGKPQRWA